MRILITNDDSINAPGLKALIDCALPFGEVVVVAPRHPQSGQSSAITVDSPLRLVRQEDFNGAKMYTVSGTPVDCVKLSLHALFPENPDLLLSGINHGSNSGNAVIYSGTMGAVLEGCMNGIKSVGFSLLHHSVSADFSLSRKFVKEIIAQVINHDMPDYVGLNVNIPAKVVPEGVKVCRAAKGYWTEEYRDYEDPFGRPFFMLTGRFINQEPDARDTDMYWLDNNYISIVPVNADMTAVDEIGRFSQVFSEDMK